jgi:hypothetical protein
MATLGSFTGQARAGGSAAQDQYTPPSIVKPGGKPTGGSVSGPLTPPGTQASAPLAAGQGSTLPFTGLSLLKVVLVGAGLLLLGLLLRRGLPRREP